MSNRFGALEVEPEPEEKQKKAPTAREKEKKKDRKKNLREKAREEKARELLGMDQSNGFLGTLTPEQEKVLQQVKQACQGTPGLEAFSDADYLRFCRARKFLTPKVVQMVQGYGEWYSQLDKESVSLPAVRLIWDIGGAFNLGHDRAGRPAIWSFARVHDPANSDVAVRNYIMLMFRAIEEMKAPVESWTCVFDLSGYSQKNSDLNWTYQVISTLQAYFPERLGCALLLNAPLSFSILWKATKPFMDVNTARKVVFVPGDYKTKLKMYFEDQHLPVSLGGTNDFDPKRWIVEQLGPAPERPPPKKSFFSFGRAAAAAAPPPDPEINAKLQAEAAALEASNETYDGGSDDESI